MPSYLDDSANETAVITESRPESFDFFAPTGYFDEKKNLQLGKEFSEIEIEKYRKKSNQWSHVAKSVGVLNSTYKDMDDVVYAFATGFAVSPTQICTDLHSIPPYVRPTKTEDKFRTIPLLSKSPNIVMNPLTKSPPMSITHLISGDHVSENVSGLSDPLTNAYFPIPFDSALWRLTEEKDRFSEYLLPSSIDPEIGNPVALIGKPNRYRDDLAFKQLKNPPPGVKLPVIAYLENEDELFFHRLEMMKSEAAKVFHNFEKLIMSPGEILQNKNHVFAVTCNGTHGCSGSPCVLIDNPRFVVGHYLRGGRNQQRELANHNAVLSVHHPEWVIRWATFVFPNLPNTDHHLVRPYVERHQQLLQKHNIHLKLFSQ